MALRFDETHFTVARQITADGVKRFLVWTARGSAVVCHLYEADSGAAAIRLARAELENAERILSSI
jgi:hypothetical protein